MKQVKPTIVNMIDIREFCKLFKISIPMYEHFDYYIDLIYRSGMNRFVYEDIEIFNDYVRFVKEETEYDNVVKYKLDYALPKMVEFIKGTKAYSRAEGFASGLGKQDFQSRDHRKQMYGKACVSLDFTKANFSMIKNFDQEGEFSSEWGLNLVNQNVHPFLARSKSFRQYVFGNTNPKMLAKIQKHYIWNLRNFLNKQGIPKENKPEEWNHFEGASSIFIQDKDFVFVSHDELIVDLSEFSEYQVQGVDVPHYSDLMEEVYKWQRLTGIEVKDTIFMEEKKNGVVIREISDSDNNIVSQNLVGVEGSKVYLELKKNILQEEIEQRDLLFKQNDSIASWVINDSQEIVKTIEYKKRGFHEYIDDKMPELDNEVKSKLVSLAINFFQNPKGEA